ncbi:MAG: type II CAAX endopeptidase family protein [Xanthobacteraceae bacterium]
MAHEASARMKAWGYWTTLGWSIVAFLLGQFVGFGVLLWLRGGALDSVLQTPFDGVLVTIFIVLSNPVTIGVLVIAVRLARSDLSDYFALKRPSGRDVSLGIVGLVVLIATTDALLYVTGRDLTTQFQLQSYTTAAAAGWLLPMLAAAILVAPAGEEAMFRGFLFRGWVRSSRSAWPAIVVISILWATLHIQYDWAGMLEIFAAGLFLGWMRWRSSSLPLTFLLHALFNLEATLETLAVVHFAK